MPFLEAEPILYDFMDSDEFQQVLYFTEAMLSKLRQGPVAETPVRSRPAKPLDATLALAGSWRLNKKRRVA
jgi:hypothetical protein